MAKNYKLQPQLSKSFLQRVLGLARRTASWESYENLRWFWWNYQRRREAGFVLPTVTMLVLVVALVVAALVARTFFRTEQVMLQRKSQTIYNAATPVLDRARAKLEYLFQSDPRFTGGIPSEATLDGFLKADVFYTVPASGNATEETRLDLNGDGTLDNAWYYETTDLDGNEQKVVYSIILRTPESRAGRDLEDQSSTALEARASNLEVRRGPLIASLNVREGCGEPGTGNITAGWFEPTGGSTAFLYKNFQINVVVISGAGNQRSVATLEMEQDRQLDKGNKWGAWFLNDLEIHPGNNSPMFWNGAVHTEGSLIVGNNSFRSFLISSEDSCLFTDDASEVSVAENLQTGFRGQIMAGIVNTNTAGGGTEWHLFGPRANRANGQFDPSRILSPDSDSVVTGTLPIDIALRPLELFTRREQLARDKDDPMNNDVQEAAWDGSDLATGRISRTSVPAPYVDDTYRADNRVGPVPPNADDSPLKNLGAKVGLEISDLPGITPAIEESMLQTRFQVNLATDPNYQTLGLDGYWERRADAQGLRIIVGERLELGNPFGWNGFTATNPDSLFPPPDSCTDNDVPKTDTGFRRCHEFRQYRSLQDNLAAAQATALYHRNAASVTPAITDPANPSQPIACLATTVHPGTLTTIRNSTDFSNANIRAVSSTVGAGDPYVNFFMGRGTNGWEFQPPPFANFAGASNDWKKALSNLAKFAGDYSHTEQNGSETPQGGAFPPYQHAADQHDTRVHPYPPMTMWGNFSNLRRAVENGNDSLADDSYVDTAGCMLGMLAYNIKQINSVTAPTTGTLITAMTDLIAGTELSGGGRVEINTDVGRNTADGYIRVEPDGTAPAFAVRIASEKVTHLQVPVEAYFTALPADLREQATAIYLKEQIAYDRSNGTSTCSLTTTPLNVLCPQAKREDRPQDRTKFPVLWYLFPTDAAGDPADHGEPANADTDKIGNRTDDTYIKGLNTGNDAYEGVNLDNIELQPRAWGSWRTPTATTGLGNRINAITRENGNNVAVAFLDKGMFDAREAMSVRVVDIDLELLRDSSSGLSEDLWLPRTGIVYGFREDSRREDAIARPAMTDWGTYQTAWDGSDPVASRRMNAYSPVDPPVNDANGVSPKPIDYYADPDRRPNGFRLQKGADLSRQEDTQGIPRGLSFISDNPVYIKGNFNLHSTTGTTANLLEEFTNTLNTTPANLWNNFYARNTAERIAETNFSRLGAGQDRWRPSEILADAITLLSDRFCDGSIEDGFRYSNQAATNATGVRTALSPMLTQYGCQTAANYTSYSAVSRPTNTSTEPNTDTGPLAWIRTNPFDPYTPTGPTIRTATFPNNTPGVSPIQFSRHGVPLILNNSTTNISPNNRSPRLTPYLQLTDEDCGLNNIKCIGVASSNYYNAILVQGIVPSRKFQPYGGLHNFPRALEDWRNKNQFISGAFIQLNFSVYTAPFDQDTWEPGQDTVSGVSNKFYAQPQRVWGYDVGLQLVPTSPIAARLTTAGNTRSEFYDEPSLDDPYVLNLRCATVDGDQLDPDATCP